MVASAVEDLRQNKGSLRRAAILHLVDDPADYVTDRLRAGLEQSGFVDLLDERAGEKVERSLNLRIAPVGELEAALREGRRMAPEYWTRSLRGMCQERSKPALVSIVLTRLLFGRG